MALSVWEATEYFSEAVVPTALGSAHRMVAPYQAIRCADGYITLGAGNKRLFDRLCDVLGHREWIGVPQFAADNASRVRHRAALAAQIEAITTAQPRSHWLTLLEANDIPCGPINDLLSVFSYSQVLAREMVVETDHPILGRITILGSPIKLSATPVDPSRPAPTLGGHTDEVLAEAGFNQLKSPNYANRGGRVGGLWTLLEFLCWRTYEARRIFSRERQRGH